MSDENESGAAVDPHRLEAMRLAVRWTERHPDVTPATLMKITSGIEAYLRTGATS